MCSRLQTGKSRWNPWDGSARQFHTPSTFVFCLFVHSLAINSTIWPFQQCSVNFLNVTATHSVAFLVHQRQIQPFAFFDIHKSISLFRNSTSPLVGRPLQLLLIFKLLETSAWRLLLLFCRWQLCQLLHPSREPQVSLPCPSREMVSDTLCYSRIKLTSFSFLCWQQPFLYSRRRLPTRWFIRCGRSNRWCSWLQKRYLILQTTWIKCHSCLYSWQHCISWRVYERFGRCRHLPHSRCQHTEILSQSSRPKSILQRCLPSKHLCNNRQIPMIHQHTRFLLWKWSHQRWSIINLCTICQSRHSWYQTVYPKQRIPKHSSRLLSGWCLWKQTRNGKIHELWYRRWKIRFLCVQRLLMVRSKQFHQIWLGSEGQEFYWIWSSTLP